jgi:hypothetical protein
VAFGSAAKAEALVRGMARKRRAAELEAEAAAAGGEGG